MLVFLFVCIFKKRAHTSVSNSYAADTFWARRRLYSMCCCCAQRKENAGTEEQKLSNSRYQEHLGVSHDVHRVSCTGHGSYRNSFANMLYIKFQDSPYQATDNSFFSCRKNLGQVTASRNSLFTLYGTAPAVRRQEISSLLQRDFLFLQQEKTSSQH